MSKPWAGFSVFILVILGWYTFHKVMRYSLEIDPKVSSALSAAKTEALLVINGLEDFHRAHGYSPGRSNSCRGIICGGNICTKPTGSTSYISLWIARRECGI